MTKGISILLRAGDDLVGAREFLASLALHNTYKPIEILLWAMNTREALMLVRPYLAKFLVLILPPNFKELSRIGQQARYESIVIVDLPTPFKSDLIPEWMQKQETGMKTALLCKKTDIASKSAVAVDVAINSLSGQITMRQQENSGAAALSQQVKTSTIKAHTFDGEAVSQPGCVLTEQEGNARVIAGMATVPQRLATLPEVLGKIAPQFDEIHVYLNGHKDKPSLPTLHNVIFHLCNEYGDLGAKGKFYGLKFTKPNDYYFSLDDDFIYPDDYVKRMLAALSRYKDKAAVCVHGSIFGDPLDWYFERTATFSARGKLECDRFVNLTGTGTFAFKLSSFPLEFIDVMPRTMCDLQVSIRAKQCGIPIVAISRESNWLSAIEIDNLENSAGDYWTRMLRDDGGRTAVAQKHEWDFMSSRRYIVDALVNMNIPINDYDYLRAEGYDVDFIKAATTDANVPPLWDSSKSEVYYLRKYQFYRSLLTGGREKQSRTELLGKPKYTSMSELKRMAIDQKNAWEATQQNA